MDCDADNSGGTRVFQFRLDPVGLGAPGISRDTNVVGIEFVKVLLPWRWWRGGLHFALGWLLFPLR